MAHIEGEIVIKRPVDEVFDFVADERNEPRYNPRMLHAEKVSDGPIGVGTEFRAETATRRGSAEMAIEITRYERPSRLESSTRLSNMNIAGALTSTLESKSWPKSSICFACELENAELWLDPVSAVACMRLLSDVTRSPLLNAALPTQDLRSHVNHIRSGFRPGRVAA